MLTINSSPVAIIDDVLVFGVRLMRGRDLASKAGSRACPFNRVSETNKPQNMYHQTVRAMALANNTQTALTI